MSLIAGTDLPESAPPEETREVTAGMSQGRLIWKRFVSNGVAMTALGFFLFIVLLSVTATGAFGIPG